MPMATKKAAAKTAKRGRISYRDTFLKKLAEASDNGMSLVSNKALREVLGWNEDRYKRIKSQLVDERVIFIARGHGGTVGRPVPKAPRR